LLHITVQRPQCLGNPEAREVHSNTRVFGSRGPGTFVKPNKPASSWTATRSMLLLTDIRCEVRGDHVGRIRKS
jgi:hypothetical protein